MKKIIISMLCIAAVFTVISVTFGLNKQTSDISYPVVGIIETVNEDTWRDDLQIKIKERAEEAGYSVLSVPSKRSQDSQIEALRSLLIFQVDSIVFPLSLRQDGILCWRKLPVSTYRSLQWINRYSPARKG